jgi:uncharacterized protein YcnI
MVKGDYGKTYATAHGGQVSSGVRELVWTGRLLDEHYDEFAFSSYLTPELKAGEMLYFPVVQECEQGVERWIDIPAEGSASPAPGLRLLPKGR